MAASGAVLPAESSGRILGQMIWAAESFLLHK